MKSISQKTNHNTIMRLCAIAFCFVSATGCQLIDRVKSHDPKMRPDEGSYRVLYHVTISGVATHNTSLPVDENGMTLGEALQQSFQPSVLGQSVKYDQLAVILYRGRAQIIIPIRVAQEFNASHIKLVRGDKIEVRDWKHTLNMEVTPELDDKVQQLELLKSTLSKLEQSSPSDIQQIQQLKTAVLKAIEEIELLKSTAPVGYQPRTFRVEGIHNRHGVHQTTTKNRHLNEIGDITGGQAIVQQGNAFVKSTILLLNRRREGVYQQFWLPLEETLDGRPLPASEQYRRLRKAPIENGDVVRYTRMNQISLIQHGVVSSIVKNHMETNLTDEYERFERIRKLHENRPSTWEKSLNTISQPFRYVTRPIVNSLN